MTTVKINGIDVKVSRSLTIKGGRVIIDGDDVTPEEKTISVEVQGNVYRLEVDHCQSIVVAGNVGSLTTQSGDVECGPVAGDVQTMSGDVTVEGDVAKDVRTMSGDVRVSGRINGAAETMSGRIRGG